MSFFAKATPGTKPRTKDVRTISLFYAAILVIFAVAQLFTFDTFTKLISSYDLPGGETMGYFVASLLVVAEVFSLPFLLGMTVSPAFRWGSMVLSWLVPLIWLKLSFWGAVVNEAIGSVGFLGTVVSVMPGWWAVFVSIALGIMAAWASWGLWPGKRAPAKK